MKIDIYTIAQSFINVRLGVKKTGKRNEFKKIQQGGKG